MGLFDGELLQQQYFGVVGSRGSTDRPVPAGGEEVVLVCLLSVSEGIQLWDGQVKRDTAKLHYIPREATELGNPLT